MLNCLGAHRKPFILICLTILICIGNTLGQQGLKAEYYDGTNFNRLEAVKYVPHINQSWYETPPVPNINPFECSIRWTGKLKLGMSGTYSFSAQVDDGIRVWIDNQLIMDQWNLNDMGVFGGTIDLVAQREYDLKVEYFNGMLEGEVRLLWKKHKEDPSWYEQLFGDGVEYTIISSEYFLPPKEPIKVVQKMVEQPKAEIKQTPKKRAPKPIQVQLKTKTKKTVQKSSSPPAKEVQKTQPSKSVMNVKTAEKFIPKNIQFEKGKTNILESSYKELNAFIDFMLEHPQLRVTVEGHTDVVGDPEMNLQLSKDRAQVIAEYLIEKGISKEKIESKGFGGSKPLVVPVKGKYHPANRRVVFKVQGFE